MSGTKEKRPNETPDGEVNQYIPKFISTTPWYNKDRDAADTDDYLAHQRKDPTQIIDYSLPVTGNGIRDEFELSGSVKVKKNEDYESKRDRWYGYDVEDWNHTLQNWSEIRARKRMKILKSQSKSVESEKIHSDDTDYELELIELNLDPSAIRSNAKEDTLEKTLRDRQDIPAYIYNITSNLSNKIRVEYDPKSRLSKDLEKGFLNNKQQFVRRTTGEGTGLTNLQKFSWELNKEDQKRQQNLVGETIVEDNDGTVFNLDLSLEASPTLMQLKQKQFQKEQEEKSNLKKQALLNKYGPRDESEPSKSEDLGTIQGKDKDASGLRRSRFAEDSYVNGHTSIFGSYYLQGKWGYQCCKQLDKNSTCNQ